MNDGLRNPTISYGSAAAVHFCFGYIQEKMKIPSIPIITLTATAEKKIGNYSNFLVKHYFRRFFYLHDNAWC